MKLFVTLPLAFAALVVSTPTKLNSRLDLGKVQDALEARQAGGGPGLPTVTQAPSISPPPPVSQPIVCSCPKILGRCIIDATCGILSLYGGLYRFYVEFKLERYIQVRLRVSL
ncbi:hypothetical protein COCMIDRAFT_106602 [Bipolaris oryzae ATCC 44560]|uniref:Hydrophobin n=1 Tax=Bipolaris oryzae ATCC 44560 TaxID=930090 RepID=W6ZC31_COCMI|nr:uncharacterized protein COCMIDRAFT_106602 [Bipolaris oryzae ATCC 44560]EUC41281.1 hypothetical protein COCMIDRAFT_106602 [Bipolaris oryzae ATCC 44560]